MIGELKLSSDRKVRFYKTQQNSFGTLPGPPATGGTCPGCTDGIGGCRYAAKKRPTCYVSALIDIYSGVRKILTHNTALLKSASLEEKKLIFDTTFKTFKTKKRNAEPNNNFRLHWSGDSVDTDTAYALGASIRDNPEINFWGYTRSFNCVPILFDICNLKLYLSLDAVNLKEGIGVYNKYRLINSIKSNISMCYMGEENRLNLTPCPVDTGKLALEEGCSNCTLCLHGEPVWFKTK
jgi:hypothetical protein